MSFHRFKKFFQVNLYILILAIVFYILYRSIFNPASEGDGKGNKLVISGHNKLFKQEIIELMDIKPGLKLEDYDLDTIEGKLRKHLRIEDVSLTIRNRNTLLLAITERQAEFIVNTNNNLYEVDKRMNLISTGEVRDHDNFIVSGDFDIIKGKKMGDKFRNFSIKLKKNLNPYPELKSRISEISMDPDGEITLYIYKPSRIKVLLGEVLDFKKIRKLYASLAYFEHNKSKVSQLDLRGDDAVYH